MPSVPHDDDTPPPDDPLSAELPAQPEPTDAVLAELLEPDRWPDEPADADPLPPSTPANDAAALLDDVPDDDGTDGLQAPITEEAPLPSLADEPVVLPWRSEVLVDGVPTAAIADPTRPDTVLTRPQVSADTAQVRIRALGVRVETTVRVVEGPSDRIRLGRDVLRGRFVVSATDT